MSKITHMQNLAMIVESSCSILFHRFTLIAFCYDLGSGNQITDVRFSPITGQRSDISDQTLALYSARNREMLEYHLPKIAEAYRKLGREEKAREVLLELENSVLEIDRRL